VYDALTSRRVYKPAYSPDVAREIIVGDSGSHFDPVVVNAFLVRFDDFQEAWTQTGDGIRFDAICQENAVTTVSV
jgi:HD-GYP domain-containing protein (c-di-GMP phosphodiesterase class II)